MWVQFLFYFSNRLSYFVMLSQLANTCCSMVFTRGFTSVLRFWNASISIWLPLWQWHSLWLYYFILFLARNNICLRQLAIYRDTILNIWDWRSGLNMRKYVTQCNRKHVNTQHTVVVSLTSTHLYWSTFFDLITRIAAVAVLFQDHLPTATCY